ncbi:GrpB family protein [Nocardioides sp. NPDC126508]
MATHPLWRPYLASANAQRQGQRVAFRQTDPGPFSEHRSEWASDFETLRGIIEPALGNLMIDLQHVGSTAILGAPAKPVIDIDLTVPDVTDEPTWLPLLEAAGFRLIFRDAMAGDEHRQLTYASPNANLHAWSPGAIEPQRHALFVAHLRTNEADRRRYAEAKHAALQDTTGARYNDLKAAVIYDIYENAFSADAEHEHLPQPRSTGNR